MRRETVLAAVVRLLDTTLVRVGNDEYARDNGSFGLTTLRNRHAVVDSGTLRLRFRGKSGVEHEVSLQDRRVARIVARCQSLPGQRLFEYVDESGTAHDVGSADVNDYLRAASGGEFIAKDFRTWHGSVLAMQLRRRLGDDDSGRPRLAPTDASRLLAQVAARLGNTVAVCKKSYVHPRVLAMLSGNEHARSSAPPQRKSGLRAAECELLALLRKPVRSGRDRAPIQRDARM